MAYRRERMIILAALFAALSVAFGFLLAGIPNIELMTLTVFLAGIFCGARLGAAAGSLSALVFSLLNPLGPAPAPLLVAQVAGFLVAGLAGGLIGPRLERGRARAVVGSAAAGFACTVLYDALTTLATAFVAFGPRGWREGVGGIAIAGAAFTAVHVGGNTIIFGTAIPVITRSVRSWRGGEASSNA